jgi:U3 small nucleolar RNA-associated protein 20
VPVERVDYTNLYVQMLKAMGGMNILESHSLQIVPHFLDIFVRDFEGEDVDMDAKAVEGKKTLQARVKIIAFCSIFADIRKPRKLHQASVLYSTFLQLVSHGDSKLQRCGMDCVLTWQEEPVIKYKDHLLGLVSDETFRDSLTAFSMETVRTTVNTVDLPILVNVLSRIIFGKLISRRGRNSAKAGLMARRAAIFSFIATMNELERKVMMDLMLEPFQTFTTEPFAFDTSAKLVPLKKQIGFLTVAFDFIKQLRTLVEPSLHELLSTIIHLIKSAEARAEDETDVVTMRQLREVRQLGLKRLTQLFTIDLEFDFTPYIQPLFEAVIDKRVPNLALENTQSPSALLELFSAWSREEKYVSYLVHNAEIVPQLLLLLSAKKVQESVVVFILSMLENIQDLAEVDATIIATVLGERLPLLLEQLDFVLSLRFDSNKAKFHGDSIPNRIIRILARISPFVKTATNASKLVSILVPFLKSPKRLVPESTKAEILEILYNFMPLLPDAQQHPVTTLYYPIVCQLFAVLESRDARAKLLAVYKQFTTFAPDLTHVYEILDNLNAYSTRRIDEPDFDRRFNGYTRINQESYSKLTVEEWRPILYNLVYYVADPEEYSIRTSAAYGLVRYIEQAAIKPSEYAITDCTFYSLLSHLVLPSIKKGLKKNIIEVRTELVQVLGMLVKVFKEDPLVSDMACLIEDEDTNFFLNIYHLQVHRRTRALRRIGQICEKGTIKPANIANIFIPIVSHFIFESDKRVDHNLINEAIAALALCTGGLSWGHYFATLRRFMNAIERRPELEKVLIRLLVQILDQFHFEIENENVVEEVVELKVIEEPAPETVDVEMKDVSAEAEDIEALKAAELDAEEADEEEIVEEAPVESGQTRRIQNAVTDKLIPQLQKLISQRNDETVPTRVPLAIAVTRLLKKLGTKAMHSHLPKILTALCNILTSHVQSARDSSKETLVTISTMLGSSYLAFIISSLQTALKRGYQLHVLGHSLHAILGANVTLYQPGTIESSIGTITDICVNDIFGEPGKERQVQELKGKMREMKTTKRLKTTNLVSKPWSSSDSL